LKPKGPASEMPSTGGRPNKTSSTVEPVMATRDFRHWSLKYWAVRYTPIKKNVVCKLDHQAYTTRLKGSMAKLSSVLYSHLMVIKAQIDIQMLLNDAPFRSSHVRLI